MPHLFSRTPCRFGKVWFSHSSHEFSTCVCYVQNNKHGDLSEQLALEISFDISRLFLEASTNHWGLWKWLIPSDKNKHCHLGYKIEWGTSANCVEKKKKFSWTSSVNLTQITDPLLNRDYLLILDRAPCHSSSHFINGCGTENLKQISSLRAGFPF